MNMAVKTDTASNSASVPVATHELAMEGLREDAVRATVGLEQTRSKVAEAVDVAPEAATRPLMFGEEMIDAFGKSLLIWTAGLQDLSRQHSAAWNTSIEAALGHFKASRAVKSVRDAIELQAGIMRGTAEKTVADTSRLANSYIKLTSEVFAPINARIGHAAGKFAKSA